MSKFETGATRTADAGRPDYEGFLSPLVVERIGEYMHKHQRQADGTMRDSDNWQKGIPLARYAKGIIRHVMHFWSRHRGWPVRDPEAGKDIEEDICAAIFGLQGYLHEVLKARIEKNRPDKTSIGKGLPITQGQGFAGIIVRGPDRSMNEGKTPGDPDPIFRVVT